METKTSNVHVKVEFQNEIRRFPLNTPSFTYLLNLSRTLYGVGENVILTAKWLDDEGDWVTITTDEELDYAISVQSQTKTFKIKLSSTQSENNPVSADAHVNWKDWRKQKKAKKQELLEQRLELVRTKIAGEVNESEKRALLWRESKIEEKLERVKQFSSSDDSDDGCHKWQRGRGRGRFGGCGGGRGRGRFGCNKQSSEQTQDQCGVEPAGPANGEGDSHKQQRFALRNELFETKMRLKQQRQACKAARMSGDLSQFDLAQQELLKIQQEMDTKKEALYRFSMTARNQGHDACPWRHDRFGKK